MWKNVTIQPRHRLTPEAVEVAVLLRHGTLHFEPGQFVVLEVKLDSGPRRSAFSIVARHGRGILLGVKRSGPGGISDLLQTLDHPISASLAGPFGEFSLIEDRPHHIFVTAGSGITPVRSLLDPLMQARQVPTVIFANLNAESAMYGASFRALHAEGFIRLVEVFDRNIDGAIRAEHQADAGYYVCGPTGLIESALGTLSDLDVPESIIQTEKYGLDMGASQGGASTFFWKTRWRPAREVKQQTGDSLLASALSEGLVLPHACEVGVCGACRAKVESGTVLCGQSLRGPGEEILTCISQAAGDAPPVLRPPRGARAEVVNVALVMAAMFIGLWAIPPALGFRSKGPMNTSHESLKCEACHREAPGTLRQQLGHNANTLMGFHDADWVPVGYAEVDNQACLDCHNRPNDRHPVSRFMELRYAEEQAKWGVHECKGCHGEHTGSRVANLEITFCQSCHSDLDVQADPIDPTHAELAAAGEWATCMSCHDFHGNHKMDVPTTEENRIPTALLLEYMEGGPDPYSEEKFHTAPERLDP